MAANPQPPEDREDLAKEIDKRPIKDWPLRELLAVLHAAPNNLPQRKRLLADWAIGVLEEGEDAGLSRVPMPVPWEFADLLRVIGRPYAWGTGTIGDWRIVGNRYDATHPVRGEDADAIRLPGDEGGGSGGRGRK